jgi:hypothetical protein
VLAMATMLACVGGIGVVYLNTRQDGAAASSSLSSGAPATGGAPVTSNPPPLNSTPESEAQAVVPVDRVAQAAATTSAEASFSFASSLTISEGDVRLKLSAKGSYDGVHRLASMEAAFEGAYPGQPAFKDHYDAVMDNSDHLVEYIRAASIKKRLPAGKSWVRMDLGDLGQTQAASLGGLQQGNGTDPKSVLGMLRHSGSPALLGHETIDGVPTTHYRAVLDPRRLLTAETDPLHGLFQALVDAGIPSFPVDAWIDASNQIRLVRISISDPNGGSGKMTITQALSNFGADVTVDLPPQASVIDYEAVAGALG